MHRASKVVSSLTLLLGLLWPATSASAADLKSCAIVGSSIVAGVLGQQTDVFALPGAPSGMDACAIVDDNDDNYTIVRENGVFSPATPVAPADIALTFFPQLTDDTVAQINAVTQSGTKISAPGFEITALGGLGDTALAVRTVPATMVSILVRRGVDAFMFQTDDFGAGPARLNTLAQAVVAPGTRVTVAGVTVAGVTVSGGKVSGVGRPAGGRLEAL